MNRAFTDLLKFICCIAIFIHHFYLNSPVVAMWGYMACSIFFFLSAYGISKSLANKPMVLFSFCKYRLLKIYKPLLIVNVLFVILTGLICTGRMGIPIFNVFCDNITFIRDVSAVQYVEYVIGISKIDSVTWFLDVLLISYLLIWAISKIQRNKRKNFAIVSAYGIYLIGCLLFPPPIYYIVDTIGIVTGLLFSVNERHIVNRLNKINAHIVIFVMALLLLAALSIQYIHHDSLLGRYQKCLAQLVAIFSLLLVIITGIYVKMKQNAVVTWLSSISYFIYLIHVKVANIVHELSGHHSIVISLVIVICLSYILYKMNKILSYDKI